MSYSYLGPCHELNLWSNLHGEIVMLLFSFAGCSEKFSKIFGVICFCLKTLDL